MFTIESVQNLQWSNSEHTQFECLVKYEEFNEPHPTGVTQNDKYSHIQEIWSKGNAGEYGVIAEYIPPEPAVIEEIPVVDIFVDETETTTQS
jgi:hypothetical protein